MKDEMSKYRRRLFGGLDLLVGYFHLESFRFYAYYGQ